MSKMITAGQFVPGSSFLHRLDGRSKLIGFLITVATVILTNTAIGYGILLVFTVFAAVISQLPVKMIFGTLRRLLVFFIILFAVNAVFYSADEPIWKWWIFTLSYDGMIQGANVVLKMIFIMLLSNILTLTTPPMVLTSAFETVLKPLGLIKVPVEEVAMILSVAIQFIPTILEETDTIRKAQTARGARFESKKLTHRAMAMLPMLIPIFIGAFRRADELSVAMEARGYRGAAYRTKKEYGRLKLRDVITLVLCAAFCAVQAIWF